MATSSIYEAISDENMTALRQWIKDGFTNSEETGGYTPLLHAVEAGNLKACKALIKAGANVNTLYESLTDSNLHLEGGIETRCTPLTLAIYHAHFDISKLLIEAGADVNGTLYITVPDHFGGEEGFCHKTTFEIVMESCDSELMDMFFARGADPDNQNSNGDTPIVEAIKMGDLHRFTNLLEWGANPAQSCDGWDSGNLISLVIEEYSSSKKTEYRKACFEMIKLLIEHGGLTKLKFYNDDLLSMLFFEAKDHELDKLFDLDGIREHVKKLEEEANTPSGLCPRTLLARTDRRYRKPRPCDIREIYYMAADKFDPHHLNQMMDVDDDHMQLWLNGDQEIPYSVWHLLIRIALSEGDIPGPL